MTTGEACAYLIVLANEFRSAPRISEGSFGEGSRVIKISEELALGIADRLLTIAAIVEGPRECVSGSDVKTTAAGPRF